MKIRLVIAIPGGGSLGAYQAGAVAALLVAVDRLRRDTDVDVTIDTIGGASAGALVSVLAAISAGRGLDPVRWLEAAWVDGVDVETLRSGTNAPLGVDRLREALRDLIVDRVDDFAGGTVPQADPINVHVTLTSLRGMSYEVDGIRPDGVVRGITFVDWADVEIDPKDPLSDLFSGAACGVDLALASAANPGAFPPQLVDRSADAETYRERGIVDFPESGHLWYTDGGVVQARPLQRMVKGAHRRAGADDRILSVVVDSRSQDPTTGEQWDDPELEPDWADALARALSLVRAQSFYDDLRMLHAEDAAIGSLGELAGVLGDHLDDEGRRAVVAWYEHHRGDDTRLPDDPIVAALRTAAGLADLPRIELSVISPWILAKRTGRTVDDLLAGEKLGDFGGFLDRELRRSDFALGYVSTETWLPGVLSGLSLADDVAERVVDEVSAAAPYRFEEVDRGPAEVGDLPWRARAELLRIALRAAWALVGRARS